MKISTKKLIRCVLAITLVVIPLLVVWDMLTPEDYSHLTANPFHVDWNSISFKNINVNSLIQTLISVSLGLMITIVVIELLLQRSRSKEQEHKRNLQLSNIMKVLRVPLYRYHMAALQITSKPTEMPEDGCVRIPVDYKVLTEAYSLQLSIKEPLLTTKIEFYASAVEELIELFTNILINIDLSNNDELSLLITEYLQNVKYNNPCKIIIGYKTQTAGNQLISDFIKENLANTAEEKIEPSNLF